MKLTSFTFICLILSSITACTDSSWAEQINTCKVNLDKKVVQLPLTPPCTLAIRSDGEVQTRNIGEKKVAIVLGSPVSKEKAAQWNMKVSDQCSTESVGLQLDSKNNPIAVSLPVNNSFLCPRLHIDQVFFMSYQW